MITSRCGVWSSGQSRSGNKLDNTEMFEKEIKFNDGTRIFCEKENGSMQRFIEYGFSPFEKEQIKKDPRLKTYFKKRVRK